jgi:hypothetical protein
VSRRDLSCSAIGVARACATPHRSVDRLRTVLESLSSGADAPRLWRIVRDGGLAPLLASAAGRVGLLHQIEPRVAAALRSALEVNALRNALIRRAALEATRALNAAGITPLWFKGVWLASHVYEQPALRPMHDVDFLVRPGSARPAREALNRIGYAFVQPGEGGAAEWNQTFRRACELPNGAGHLEIDLHEELRLSDAVVWSALALWATARHSGASNAAFMVPSPEAGLLYGAVHLFKHGFDLRHAVTAVSDAFVLLQQADDELDTGWLAAQLANPLNATALYMLLTLLGDATTRAGADLLRSARVEVDRIGSAGQADTIVASAERLPLMTADDFSLFDVGESGTGWSTLRKLAAGTARWRRRVNDGAANRRVGELSRLLTRANWRYAYTSYRAGRLSAKLQSSTSS